MSEGLFDYWLDESSIVQARDCGIISVFYQYAVRTGTADGTRALTSRVSKRL
jgi:hypothetical protein